MVFGLFWVVGFFFFLSLSILPSSLDASSFTTDLQISQKIIRGPAGLGKADASRPGQCGVYAPLISSAETRPPTRHPKPPAAAPNFPFQNEIQGTRGPTCVSCTRKKVVLFIGEKVQKGKGKRFICYLLGGRKTGSFVKEKDSVFVRFPREVPETISMSVCCV